MHNIHMGLYPNSPMKSAPCLPFIWIWKVVNYFVWLKVNFSMSGQVIVINIYFLWRLWRFWCWFILVILCLASFLTPSKIKTSPFYFPSISWDLWLNFKLLCNLFLQIYSCTWYCLSKSYWYDLCLLGLPCILWIHM